MTAASLIQVPKCLTIRVALVLLKISCRSLYKLKLVSTWFLIYSCDMNPKCHDSFLLLLRSYFWIHLIWGDSSLARCASSTTCRLWNGLKWFVLVLSHAELSVLYISETKQCCSGESWNNKLLVTTLKHYPVKVGRSMKIKRLVCKQTSNTLTSMPDSAHRKLGFDFLRKFLSKLFVA